MKTTEHSINDAIAELLRGTRFAWRDEEVIRSETTGQLADSSGLRPDIVVEEPLTAAVVIETEWLPALTVEEEALSRLGEELRGTGQPIMSAIALRLPQRLRDMQGQALRQELASTHDMDFALFTETNWNAHERHPKIGWQTGGIFDLSLLIQSAAIPPILVDRAAARFEMGVNQAAEHLKAIAEKYPVALENIAAELHQQDSTQTRRMAMAILVNAFLFHEHLAGGHGALGQVLMLHQLEDAEDGLLIPAILEEWEKILEVNYWPIFDISRRILRSIPDFQSNAFLKQLARTTQALTAQNLMRSHDLTGTVFQRLISDRKFLAAFYTTPASAALLVGLTVNEDSLLSDGDWSNPQAVKGLRIADFACGTGTLLSTAYQRISQLHELHGGEAEAIHTDMMARSLVGVDILPAAAHLTAAMLAGAYPRALYDDSAVFTQPYGLQEDGKIALGSIDLLRDMALLEGSEITAKAIEATKGEDIDSWRYAPHFSFDLVIMNPPFTRATNHEGQHENVPNPMFAAFGSSAEEQKAMADAAKELTKGTVAHGNAGEASIFLALADRKLAKGGMLAMVMPLSLLTGSSWQKCRVRLAEAYDGLILISIAGGDSKSLSFSADTGMGECLVIGKRNGKRQSRATFIVLEKSPAHPAFSFVIAQHIKQLINDKAIRRLEGNPVGGTHITVGEEIIGQMLDVPLPKSGSWKVARIVDLSLAQTAYQLADKKRVWLPAQKLAVDIPMSTVGEIGKIGPIGRDINGINPDGSIRGPFELRQIPKGGVPTYPVLWAHNAKRERTMQFTADCEGIPRFIPDSDEIQEMVYEKAAQVFDTASHCHSNVDFQYSSQSTSMQFTARKTIGGRAWISIELPTAEHEKALVAWANTTMGLLMYWWHGSRQQAGRGSIPKTALHSLPILDVTALSPNQLQRAAGIFDDMKHLPLKPVHELDSDANRKALDRRFYAEVLGAPDAILVDDGPLDILRHKLCREPSIRGSKT